MLITFLGDVEEYENAKYIFDKDDFKKNVEIENEINYLPELANVLGEKEILIFISLTLIDKNKEKILEFLNKFYNINFISQRLDDFTEIFKISKNVKNKVLKKINFCKQQKVESFYKNIDKENYKIRFFFYNENKLDDLMELLKGYVNKYLLNCFDKKENEIVEISIDITHSFRHIPMLVLLTLNTLSIKNNISIQNIIYAKKENNDPTNKKFLIKKVNSLGDLLSWYSSLNSFIKIGELEELINMFEEKGINKKCEDKDKKEYFFIDALKELDFYFKINYLEGIEENLKKVRICLESEDMKIKFSNFPLSIIYEDFKNFVKKMLKNDLGDDYESSAFQLNLAKWHVENRRYLLSLINLQEAIKTWSLENMRKDKFNRKCRNKIQDKISKALDIYYEYNNRKIYNFNCFEKNTDAKKYWCLISNLRNVGSHSLKSESPNDNQQQVENIKNNLEKYEEFLKSLNKDKIKNIFDEITKEIKNINLNC